MDNYLEKFLYMTDAWKKHLQDDPDAAVLSDTSGIHYSRKETDDLSDRVHSYLKQNHVGKNDVVLIHLERGVKPVIAIMGVIKAGAAFVIAEKGYAAERVEYIRKDCGSVFELNEENWPDAVSCEPRVEYEIPDDHDLALCVYTSGTSGNPKGVMHEYGQIKLEMISEMQKDGSWRENTEAKWALAAPLNFVASLKIFVHFMYSGGHLHVLDYDTVKNPKKLTSYLLNHQINETFLSPSLLRLQSGGMGPFMKYVYTGAEAADNVAVNHCDVINTYTMSESFFTVCEYVIREPLAKAPIGRPCFDLDIKLIDEEGNESAESGEMCFYNPYCRGYINLPGENETSFIGGWFHTGDLAVLTDGQYVLKGRRDDMVKIDGNRIEPAEIENACRKVLGLSWCAARGFEEKGAVALYYTDAIEINEEETREKLKDILPYYMIPSFFVQIDEIPLTASGKLNRRALQFPDSVKLAEYVAPRDAFEQKLTEIMAEVLGLEKIGIRDDFFTIGGNSIRAIEVLGKADIENLNADILYRGRTVEKIHELYTEAEQKLSDAEKEEIGRSAKYPLNDMQKWLWFYANNGTHDFFRAYRLSSGSILEKLRDVFNSYMKVNSSFHMVIETENGEPVQVYQEEVPLFEIENMTEEDVRNLQKTFIEPFVYGKPLYRIRFIRTPEHDYLFFCLSHIITDGSGLHLILQDLETLYRGGTVRPAYYFASVYDNMTPASEEDMKEADTYFLKTLDHPHRMRYLRHDRTGRPGQLMSLETSFPLDRIENIVKKYNVTNAVFINLAAALALEHFNGEPSLIEPVFDNRSPNENIAGVKAVVGGEALTCQNRTLENMFKDLMEQQYGNIRYAYYYFDAHVDHSDGMDSFAVTYLQDWFSSENEMLNLGEVMELENTHVREAGGTGENNIIVSHENGKMAVVFKYNAATLSDEHARQFITALEFAGNEILNDRVPQFPEKAG